MTSSSAASPIKASQTVRAEAAAWIARLHSADRTAADERSFQRWLAASAEHAAVFERMTELWEAGARLKSDALARVRREPDRRRSNAPVAIAAMLLLFVAAGVAYWSAGSIETTRIGEQRILTLEDGTRITLNTATRIDVRYSDEQRHVDLIRGEALFEVARRTDRPFVVTAGDSRVTALGTSFVVREDGDLLAVILVEGKVAVATRAQKSPEANADASTAEDIVMQPGQRLILASAGSPALDRPPLDKVTAWRRGLIALDNTPLPEAIAEMNRYSTVQLELDGEPAKPINVSGVFRAGDSAEFARALARTHGLRAVEQSRRIRLFFE